MMHRISFYICDTILILYIWYYNNSISLPGKLHTIFSVKMLLFIIALFWGTLMRHPYLFTVHERVNEEQKLMHLSTDHFNKMEEIKKEPNTMSSENNLMGFKNPSGILGVQSTVTGVTDSDLHLSSGTENALHIHRGVRSVTWKLQHQENLRNCSDMFAPRKVQNLWFPATV